MPYGQTLTDRATQLLIKDKSGALVTQFGTNKSPLLTFSDLKYICVKIKREGKKTASI